MNYEVIMNIYFDSSVPKKFFAAVELKEVNINDGPGFVNEEIKTLWRRLRKPKVIWTKHGYS